MSKTLTQQERDHIIITSFAELTELALGEPPENKSQTIKRVADILRNYRRAIEESVR